jgi:glycosyltransferase involved in cell wall biosynthesis
VNLSAGVTLVGYAYGELGIGEDVRSMAAALSAAEVQFSIEDFSAGLRTRAADKSVDTYVRRGFPHPVTCFCLTGFDTARFWLERGHTAFQNRFVIGYWPWELPTWPDPWRAAIDLVDEIWVSSTFTQEAFALISPVPVIRMPMAVTLPPGDLPKLPGFPDRTFTALFVFDANSYLERKNPLAAIEAFRLAFPAGNEPAMLILKVMNEGVPDSPQWAAIRHACAQDRRVKLLHGTMTRPEVLGLMAQCDVYLSLHRAEGFGRTIAEAMLLGKPVIATDWSGSRELVRPDTAVPVAARLVPVPAGAYPWGRGCLWADPDVAQAAYWLRRLFDEPELRDRLGRAGRQHVADTFAPQVVGRRYAERLANLR